MRNAIVALALLAGAVTASADHYASFYVIPVASHVRGLFGTNWMSDVAIQNFQSTPLMVDMTFVRTGEGVGDNVVALGATTVVPPGGSVMMQDVLAAVGPSEAGAILIGADAPFAVTSRSYVMTASGDTIGQTVIPARDFLESSLGDTDETLAVAYVPGLISNSRFRTNLGFVAAANNNLQGMTVQVTVRRADGTPTGTRTFLIPRGIRHLHFSSTTVGSGTFDIGSAEFRIVAGDGAVVPYASVINNATADAVFVLGQFPPNVGTPERPLGLALQRYLIRSGTDR
jgi:hypothetical protein